MRIIRINNSLEQLLNEWKELSRNETYVFQNRNNSFYSSNTAVYWLNQILEGTNFPRITPHGFRHTHASLLAEAGADLKDIQDMAIYRLLPISIHTLLITKKII